MIKKTGLFLVLIIGVSFSSLFAGGQSESDGSPERIVIGYQAIPNGQIISKENNWLEEATGISVEWVQINSGSELNTGLAAGSIDIGLSGSSGIAAGIANSVPF